MKEGDVVLCENTPDFASKTWSLANVVIVHPVTDRMVRVMTLKNGNGEFE